MDLPWAILEQTLDDPVPLPGIENIGSSSSRCGRQQPSDWGQTSSDTGECIGRTPAKGDHPTISNPLIF